MKEQHTHKFDQRVKRKIPMYHYGATVHTPQPNGTLAGYDYLLVWKCKCGLSRAEDILERLKA